MLKHASVLILLEDKRFRWGRGGKAHSPAAGEGWWVKTGIARDLVSYEGPT